MACGRGLDLELLGTRGEMAIASALLVLFLRVAGGALTEIDADTTVINDAVVHLQIGPLTRLTISKLDEPITETVLGDRITDDLTANDVTKL